MTTELVCQNNQTNLIASSPTSLSNLVIYTGSSALTTINTSPVIITNDQVTFINNELRQGNRITVTHSGEIIVQSNVTTASTFINNYFYGTPTQVTSTTCTGIYNNIHGTCWYNNYSNIHLPSNRNTAVKKTTRNSIKRALKLMSNFGMEEETRIFLGGDKVEISHSESIFKFVIEKYKNNLIRSTEHCGNATPYKLGLYTKTNIHIANLCVIFQDTPLLDQVFGLSMFVKNGCEDELLEKANFFSINQDKEILRAVSIDNPVLQKKLRLNHFTIH